MRRKRRSRKQTKLSPGIVFLVLCLGVVVAAFQKSEKPAVDPLPNQIIENRAPEPTAEVHEANASVSLTQPDSDPAPAPLQGVETVTRFVTGRKVALRDGPGKTFSILDRYDTGRELLVTESDGDWSKVTDRLTQRVGWIATALLSDERPAPLEIEKREKKPSATTGDPSGSPPVAPSIPQIPDSIVVQRIIAESIAMYPGSCACPYNTDRGGRRCGKRSAYNRGGGYAPICFAGDVSGEMIASFRQ
jgi:hypothetical protein